MVLISKKRLIFLIQDTVKNLSPDIDLTSDKSDDFTLNVYSGQKTAVKTLKFKSLHEEEQILLVCNKNCVFGNIIQYLAHILKSVRSKVNLCDFKMGGRKSYRQTHYKFFFGGNLKKTLLLIHTIFEKSKIQKFSVYKLYPCPKLGQKIDEIQKKIICKTLIYLMYV